MKFEDTSGEHFGHTEIADNLDWLLPATAATKIELFDAILGAVGESASGPLRTTCAVINAPDGLQLQQTTSSHTAISIKNRETCEDGRTIIEGSIDVDSILARKASFQMENELGLTFVSEPSARYFVDLLRQARSTPPAVS